MSWFTVRLLFAFATGVGTAWTITLLNGPAWVRVLAAVIVAAGFFVLMESIAEGWRDAQDVLDDDGSGERPVWSSRDTRSLSAHHAWEYGSPDPDATTEMPAPVKRPHRPTLLDRWARRRKPQPTGRHRKTDVKGGRR